VHSTERVRQVYNYGISGDLHAIYDGLTAAVVTSCLQDHMCGLWKLESDETKCAPLICLLQSRKGIPLTCGFGKLGSTEMQCFAGYDSGYVVLWTVGAALARTAAAYCSQR